MLDRTGTTVGLKGGSTCRLGEVNGHVVTQLSSRMSNTVNEEIQNL